MSDYHVVKNQNGDWEARQNNTERSSFHGETHAEAESAAKRFAANSGMEK